MTWPCVKIEGLRDSSSHSLVGGPFGSDLTTRHYVDDGVPVIRGVNLPDDLQFYDDGFVFVSTEKADALAANNAGPGDVVFTQRGTLGQVGLIPHDSRFPRYLISQSQMKLTVDAAKVNSKFVFYYFRHPTTIQKIKNYAITSGVPHINLGILRRFEIPLPPLHTQNRIVETLGAYDDLIENNRRRMALLEESARLLYQEWFVRLRFPGHEHVGVFNGIPAGWKIANFSEFVDYLEGPVLRNRQYRSEGIPFLNIRTIKDDEIDLTKVQFIDEVELQAKYRHFLLEEDDHVVSSSGTLGRVVTIRGCHLPVMLNTSLIRMRAKSYLSKWFVKSYLKHGDYVDQVTSMATGSAQLNYGPSHLAKLQFMIPTLQIASLYDDFVSPCFRQIKTLLDANLKLRAARDLLLPRLMNGEVVV